MIQSTTDAIVLEFHRYANITLAFPDTRFGIPLMWIYFGLISAIFLGCYDVVKKASLNRNAVIPVLFLSTVAGALPWLVLAPLSRICPAILAGTPFFVPAADGWAHFLIFIKAVIVASSWMGVYFGMKHLPISIAAPVRASAPFWTLLGAMAIFMERPTGIQWIGLALIIVAYFFLSLAGRAEGIIFHRNRWVALMFAGTLIGAISALYDKYLLKIYPAALVQTWFAIYLVVVLAPVLLLGWYPTRHKTTPFQWRWTIPLIGLCLAVADFLYFLALRDPESMISILSAIRRSNAIISFAWGATLFKEVNRGRKAICLTAILAGILILALSRLR
jgi:transporter family protein